MLWQADFDFGPPANIGFGRFDLGEAASFVAMLRTHISDS
jgi:hypothetical protein